MYWHPVGAEDADLLVMHDIFSLSESFAAVRHAFDREGEHAKKLRPKLSPKDAARE